jgi:hypothetical protein
MKYNLFFPLLLAEKIVQYSQGFCPFRVVATALDILGYLCNPRSIKTVGGNKTP